MARPTCGRNVNVPRKLSSCESDEKNVSGQEDHVRTDVVATIGHVSNRISVAWHKPQFERARKHPGSKGTVAIVTAAETDSGSQPFHANVDLYLMSCTAAAYRDS